MKILAVSDVTAKYYFDYYTPGKLDGIDLIVSCGDLHREYLEFLVTMSNRPVLYVHGNHDECYDQFPPEGCTCIDDKIYVYQGLRILGLGGSYRYRDGKYMYTEAQMCRRIRRLRSQLRKYGGIDILVTHAPARHIKGFENTSYRGFSCFLDLPEQYEPKYSPKLWVPYSPKNDLRGYHSDQQLRPLRIYLLIDPLCAGQPRGIPVPDTGRLPLKTVRRITPFPNQDDEEGTFAAFLPRHFVSVIVTATFACRK